MHLNLQKILLLLLTALTLLVIFSGCSNDISSDKNTDGDESKISIAVSILPEKEFAESVGGEKVNVNVLIPPGSSPHTYELTSGQLKSLAETDIYAVTGSGIEFELAWMDKIIDLNPDMVVVNLSDGISLLKNEGESAGTDPHIWLSPKNAKIMSENICNALIRMSPESEQYFRDNLHEYEKKLDSLDENIRVALSKREDEYVMVYHPAWSYFARDYSLNLISVEVDGKEPSPSELAELIDKAEINNIKVIFASPEYSTKSAEVIAKTVSGKIVLIDPLSGDYIENMESVARAFSSE
ncbi:MAG: zinc ABC transporter substrate-binding protein [Methanomicrobiaceae archaeon]|nr:zinc ABC transporter substrate-binding protein [Methanomicrobiaceae archaeon]